MIEWNPGEGEVVVVVFVEKQGSSKGRRDQHMVKVLSAMPTTTTHHPQPTVCLLVPAGGV